MIFGRKQIAQLKSDLDASEAREKELRKEIARTGVLLTDERIAHKAALDTIVEQQDEAARLRAKLAKHTRGLSLGTIASAAARKAAAAPVAGVA